MVRVRRGTLALIGTGGTLNLVLVTIPPEPTTADNLQGWGTLAAAVIALITLIVLVYEVRRGNRDRRDAAAGQARLVYVRRGFESSELADGQPVYSEWRIRNDSPGPIFDVKLIVIAHPDKAGDHHVGGRRTYDVLRAGQEITGTWANLVWSATPNTDKIMDDQLFFTDANGRKWFRPHLSQPIRDLEPGPPAWLQRLRQLVPGRRTRTPEVL